MQTIKNENLKLVKRIKVKLIYSGFVDGIFDHDNVHRFGSEEAFSDKYDDNAIGTFIYDLGISDLPN